MLLPFLILFLPLIAAATILLGTRKNGHASAVISVASVLVTLAGSIALLCGAGANGALPWMSFEGLKLNIGVEIDNNTRSMMFIVTDLRAWYFPYTIFAVFLIVLVLAHAVWAALVGRERSPIS